MKKIVFLFVFVVANSLALEPIIEQEIESFCEQFPHGIDEELLSLGEEVLAIGDDYREHECYYAPETDDDCVKILQKLSKLVSTVNQGNEKIAYIDALLTCVYSIRSELARKANSLNLDKSQFDELQEEALNTLKNKCRQCKSSNQNNN